MNRRTVGWFLVLVALGASACSPQSAAPGGYTIAAGKGVGDIALGMSRAKVVRLLGEPTGVRVGGDGTILYFEFERAGLTVALEDGRVARIGARSVWKTPEGLGIGSPASAVVAALGPPQEEERLPGLSFLHYHTNGITFSIEQKVRDSEPLVSSVAVFRPK